MRLFGQDQTFFDLLVGQAQAANEAAREFYALSRDFGSVAKHTQRIREIEQAADKLTHQFVNKVDSTFVTPLDKEDLHTLSSGMDDVTDAIEAAAARLILYRIQTPRPDLEPLLSLLVQITDVLIQAVSGVRHLQDRAPLQSALTRIHEIESEADQQFRQALSDLFNEPDPNPLNVLKWKDIYDPIEKAIDRCEHAATVIEGILVKYA